MRFLSVPTLLLASACASVNPVTLVKLATLSPLEADPALMAVEIDLPENLNIVEGTAIITVFSERSDTGELLKEDFILDVLADNRYQFAAADLDRLRQTQATAKQWETEALAANSGGFSVSLEPCIIGDGPTVDAGVNIRISFDESGTFYPLVTNGRISDVADAEELSQVPQCSSSDA